jgi:hypothetical protein
MIMQNLSTVGPSSALLLKPGEVFAYSAASSDLDNATLLLQSSSTGGLTWDTIESLVGTGGSISTTGTLKNESGSKQRYRFLLVETSESLAGDIDVTLVAPGKSERETKLNVVVSAYSVSALTITNMSEVESLLASANRHEVRADLAPFTHYRIVAKVRTASASENDPRLYASYKVGESSNTPGDYTSLGAAVVSMAVADMHATPWTEIAFGARRDVNLSILMAGGDGVADPVIDHVSIQFS